MEEYYSWEEVECAQPAQNYVQLHDESWDHVEQLKCTNTIVNGALYT